MDGQRRLEERIAAAARHHGISHRHAGRLVWMQDEGNGRPESEYLDAAANVRRLSEGSFASYRTTEDWASVGDISLSDDTSDFDQAVAARAAQLAEADRNKDYRQQAMAELIDRGDVELWEPVDTRPPAQRTSGQPSSYEEKPDADTILVKHYAKEHGIDEMAAMQLLYDTGEIG